MKLCIGTVQFGMPYGICNQHFPSLHESISMLDYATQNGINTIDTAQAYGQAEQIIGEFLKRKTIPREQLTIVSKLMPNCLDDIAKDDYVSVIRHKIQESLVRLNIDYLDGFLLHSARYVFDDEILDALSYMKREGFCKQVGVSIYESDEALRGIESKHVDLLQVPYSILDQRMLKERVFENALFNKIEIHVRSAFLQGILVDPIATTSPAYPKLNPICMRWKSICSAYQLNPITVALQYVKNTANASKLVFGVNHLQQLKENIQAFSDSVPMETIESIAREFSDVSDTIVIPSLWEK